MNCFVATGRDSTRRLLAYARPHRLRFVLALLLMVLATLSEMAIPYLMKVMLDERIIPGEFDWLSLAGLAGGILGLYLLAALLQYQQVLMLQKGALAVINRLRQDLVAHLLKLPVRVFDQQPVGQLVSRVSNDTESMRELFVTVLPTLIQGGLRVVGALTAIALLDWYLMLLSLLLLPVLFGAMQLYRRRSAPLFDGARESISKLNSRITESLRNMPVIQAFNLEQQNHAEFERVNQQWSQFSQKTVGINSLLLMPFNSLLGLLASAVVVAWFGYHRGLIAQPGALEIGSLYAFLIYLERFFEPFRQLSMQLSKLQVSSVAAERVFELMDEPVDPQLEQTVGRALHLSPHHSPVSEISFERVNLSYDGGERALHDVSFVAPAGKVTAIVGHSGSGKSSIINLLMRFYPYQRGEVRIDGQPLGGFSEAQLRQRFALVQQEPVIFSGSIADNIRMAEQQLEEADIWRAASQGQIDRVIKRFPEGMDQRLTASGQSLSMGERQLLAFARTFAQSPGVLLLDEATAYIDSETEGRIQQALSELQQGRTTLVVAHRLSTIVDADQILVMDKGRIVQRGTHAELVAVPGSYRALYLAQQQEQSLRSTAMPANRAFSASPITA